MAGLLAYVAAGMAKGAGDSMIEKAKAKREDAREELRYQRQVARDEADRGFRRGERQETQEFQTNERVGRQEFDAGQADADRGFRRGEAETQRTYDAEQRALDRTSQQILQGSRLSAERRRQLETDDQFTQFYTNENGELVGVRKVGPAEVIKDENGNPVKAQTKTRPNDPVMDAKRMDEIADKRARAVAGPEPDQQSLSYDPADLDAWNEKYMKALNTEREKLGLDPVGSVPAAATPTTATPNGAGTEEDPYTPTSQEEFNALPSGAVYLNPADNKLYRKN
jgi:hypothetical protein